MKQTALSTDEILEHLVLFTADLANAVAPLIEKTQPQLGKFAVTMVQPTPIQTANELRSRVGALRQLYCGLSVALRNREGRSISARASSKDAAYRGTTYVDSPAAADAREAVYQAR